MKRLYFIISLLFVINSLFSQESSQNYVLTRTFLNESGTKYIDNIQYFDGLGRPTQTVQKGVTPNRSNLVTLQEYDGFGRATKSWLPHVSTSSYLDPVSFKSAVPGTYNGDSRPYDETVYENSPLNRVLEQYGTGTAWSQHPVSTSYLTNTVAGELSCKLYYVNSSGGLSQRGMYAAGELYVVKTTDEDGNVSYLFTDKLGQQILSRQVLMDPMYGHVLHDTYYVYDDYDQLCFVLPPSYQDTPSLSLYAYQYKYDDRGRCIEKTLPGCDPIKYCYDRADHLIFSQDGVQRAGGEWTFYLYDAFQRLVVRGTCLNTNTSQVRDLVVTTWLSRDPSTRMILPEGIDGRGYSSSFGIVSPTLHLVNYYDDYSFLDLYGFSDKEGCSVNATGLLTGSTTFLLNGYSEYCTVMHYDYRGRITRTISDNDLFGTETTATTYTFTGKPLVVTHVHTTSGDPTHTEVSRYTYDHAERLTEVAHQLDANPAVILSANTYDELGRLQSKTFHGNSSMRTTYTYNIRNWLTRLSGNAFKQSLYYNATFGGAPKCYNGNISRIEWNLGTGLQQSYDFTYDGLNRLVSANYTGSQVSILGDKPDFSERILEYDKQGNILRLQRHGPGVLSTLIDDLTFDYYGNRLVGISDAVTDPLSSAVSNYSDLNGYGLPDFAYDVNGNMTQDLDKEITSISYNPLNLPNQVTFSATEEGSKEISYHYDASGFKHRVEHITPVTSSLVPMASPSLPGGIIIGGKGKKYINTTTYCGNMIYSSLSRDNGTSMSLLEHGLERILTEEGYITLDGTTPVYHYFLKDHLGNVRVVMNEDGKTVEQSNNYYPFGGIFNSKGESEQPYKFNGKELETMHGLNWYDYGARMKGDWRFTTMDPLCEKYYSVSPYAYCLNNPVRFVDPGGDSVRVYTETHATGHTWISVGEGNNMVVYSYGRYNGTNKGPNGSFNSLANGPGVLLKLTGDEAKAYNNDKSEDGMSVFVVTDVTDEIIATAMDEKFNSSAITPDKGIYKDNPSAHVIDEYSLTSNNCTTVVSDVLNESGSNALKGNILQQSSSFGTYSTIPVTKRFILPVLMQNYLNKISKAGSIIHKTK